MVEPSFTVVVPCFNGAACLAAALRSALDQPHPAAEILVIDDGSTDGSPEIARWLGPRVVSLSQAHQGPSAARNLGADRAQGRSPGCPHIPGGRPRLIGCEAGRLLVVVLGGLEPGPMRFGALPRACGTGEPPPGPMPGGM